MKRNMMVVSLCLIVSVVMTVVVNYLAPKGTRLVTRSYGPGVTTV